MNCFETVKFDNCDEVETFLENSIDQTNIRHKKCE